MPEVDGGVCCVFGFKKGFIHFLDQMQCEKDRHLWKFSFSWSFSALGWGSGIYLLKLFKRMSLGHWHSRLPRLLIASLQHLWCLSRAEHICLLSASQHDLPFWPNLGDVRGAVRFSAPSLFFEKF